MNMVLPWIAVAAVGLQAKPSHKVASTTTSNQYMVTKVLGVLGYELAPKAKGFYYVIPSVIFVMLYSILPHKVKSTWLHAITRNNGVYCLFFRSFVLFCQSCPCLPWWEQLA